MPASVLASFAGGSWRARGAVLPDDDRRDPLPNERFGPRILPQRSIAMRVNVDEPRSDGESFRVDLRRAPLRRATNDRHDLAACDHDVALDTSAAESVE